MPRTDARTRHERRAVCLAVAPCRREPFALRIKASFLARVHRLS
jgi:hypothetical protein